MANYYWYCKTKGQQATQKCHN